ncbi:MAG: phenylalanine--tRNA ligase subunit beta [Candidatus Portnoybacteria bacterium]|nr:phenylalanine--tRNA ligase subunit beta [Candidatus Portnoybacteria bacterium]
MKFSASWLNEYLEKTLKPQEMVDLLTMHAFEVESLEKFGDDFILDVKILPDRAHDCFSHMGIAKELAAISGIKFVPPKADFAEDGNLQAKDFISVKITAKDLCPRYSMRVATDIKMGQSPKWMQDRLSACGLRPISNIVDITNYIMLETGQPLHAFDVDKVGEKKIIVRRAKEGEKIVTLEGKKYDLSPENLVIADAKVAIGIAGIKGGEGPEIDQNTKVVAVESANFEPTNIRRTSKAFNLRTDASMRFENGFDPNLTEIALARAIFLMSEIAGGKVAAGLVDAYSVKAKPRKILLDVDWAQKLIGVQILPQEMIDILKRLEIPAKAIKKGKFIEAIAPTSRLDLRAQEDLAEELARIFGLDKIPAQTPSGIMIAATKEESLVYEDKIKDILAGAGWSEAQNYSFVSEEDAKAFEIAGQVKIKNPISQDQKYLQPTLIVNLLKNTNENLKYFDNVRLFEIGRSFMMTGEKPVESHKIAAVISNRNFKKSAEGFFELKGLVHILFEKLGISDVWFDDEISFDLAPWLKIFHPVKRALIKSGQKEIGWIGEIKEKILNQSGIKNEIVAFELDLPALVALASEERAYQAPSKYPAIMRDLAILVGDDVKIESVLNIIETMGGSLLFDTDIFDIFETGVKKSLAFRLIFQSDERNMTDKEVNEIMEKIIKAIEEEGWQIRK